MELDPLLPFRVPDEINNLLWEFVGSPADLFYFAAEQNHVTMLPWIEKHWFVRQRVKEAALSLAASQGHFAAVCCIDNPLLNGHCAFINACSCDQIDILNLLSAHILPECVKSTGFWEAAQQGNLRTIKWFIEQYAPNREMFCADENLYSNAPLQLVARKGHVEVLEYIIAAYGLQAHNIMAEYLISHAISGDQYEMVKWLTEYFQFDSLFRSWWNRVEQREFIVQWLASRNIKKYKRKGKYTIRVIPDRLWA